MQPSVMRKEQGQTETTMGTSGGLCRASSVTAPSEDQRTGVKITAAYPGEDHFSHSVTSDDQWHLRSRHVETREKELRTGVRTGASKSVSIHSNGLISKPGQANFVAGFTTAKRKVDSNGMKSTTKFWSDVIVIYRIQWCNSALSILGLACVIH